MLKVNLSINRIYWGLDLKPWSLKVQIDTNQFQMLPCSYIVLKLILEVHSFETIKENKCFSVPNNKNVKNTLSGKKNLWSTHIWAVVDCFFMKVYYTILYVYIFSAKLVRYYYSTLIKIITRFSRNLQKNFLISFCLECRK